MAQETTPSYMELSTQAFSLWTDAIAAANQRTLDYYKSLFQIATRPYTSTALETAARENFDRANQIVSLTVDELETEMRKSAEFAQKLVEHNAKVQDSYVNAMRGLVDTGMSNLNFVRESAERQVDELSKRAEDVKRATASAVSQN